MKYRIRNITTEMESKFGMNRYIQIQGTFEVIKSNYEVNRVLTLGKSSVKTEFILI